MKFRRDREYIREEENNMIYFALLFSLGMIILVTDTKMNDVACEKGGRINSGLRMDLETFSMVKPPRDECIIFQAPAFPDDNAEYEKNFDILTARFLALFSAGIGAFGMIFNLTWRAFVSQNYPEVVTSIHKFDRIQDRFVRATQLEEFAVRVCCGMTKHNSLFLVWLTRQIITILARFCIVGILAMIMATVLNFTNFQAYLVTYAEHFESGESGFLTLTTSRINCVWTELAIIHNVLFMATSACFVHSVISCANCGNLIMETLHSKVTYKFVDVTAVDLETRKADLYEYLTMADTAFLSVVINSLPPEDQSFFVTLVEVYMAD